MEKLRNLAQNMRPDVKKAYLDAFVWNLLWSAFVLLVSGNIGSTVFLFVLSFGFILRGIMFVRKIDNDGEEKND